MSQTHKIYRLLYYKYDTQHNYTIHLILYTFNIVSFIILASQNNNTFLHNDAICCVRCVPDSQTNGDVRGFPVDSLKNI